MCIAKTMREVLSEQAGTFVLEVFENGSMKRMVDSVLSETGRWPKRNRLLHSRLVLWTVVAMAAHRSLSVANAFLKVVEAMRGELDLDLRSVTPEAVIKARRRLGWEPLELLARETGRAGTPAPSFFGFIPMAVDGVQMTAPNSPRNRIGFGVQPASRGETAFPHVFGLFLIYTDTRIVVDAVWGAWNMGELGPIELLLEHLGPSHVLFLDRRYTKVDLWLNGLLRRGIHFVHRLSAIYDAQPIEQLGKGDWLIDVHGQVLRLIEYKVGDKEIVQLITDLKDSVAYPARELALGYHNRWEIELAYDELKTHLASVLHGTQHTVFRSHTPAGVIQEAWALVTTYNMLRGLMVEAGARHEVPPLEISFVDTLQVVRDALPRLQSCKPAKRPVLMRRMLRDIANSRLDRSRRPRVTPRRIKVKMSKFHLRRPGDRSVQRDFAAELVLM